MITEATRFFGSYLTENLLMFGLGRVIEEHDAPAIRQVLRKSKADNYRFSSLIVGLTNSTPFRMRRSP